MKQSAFTAGQFGKQRNQIINGGLSGAREYKPTQLNGTWSGIWDSITETASNAVTDLFQANVDTYATKQKIENTQEIITAQEKAGLKPTTTTTQEKDVIIIEEPTSPGLFEWVQENPGKTLIGTLLLAKMFGVI